MATSTTTEYSTTKPVTTVTTIKVDTTTVAVTTTASTRDVSTRDVSTTAATTIDTTPSSVITTTRTTELTTTGVPTREFTTARLSTTAFLTLDTSQSLPQTTTPEPGTEFPIVVVAAASGGGLVVLILVIVLAVLGKRGKLQCRRHGDSEKGPSQSSATLPNPHPEPMDQNVETLEVTTTDEQATGFSTFLQSESPTLHKSHKPDTVEPHGVQTDYHDNEGGPPPGPLPEHHPLDRPSTDVDEGENIYANWGPSSSSKSNRKQVVSLHPENKESVTHKPEAHEPSSPPQASQPDTIVTPAAASTLSPIEAKLKNQFSEFLRKASLQTAELVPEQDVNDVEEGGEIYENKSSLINMLQTLHDNAIAEQTAQPPDEEYGNIEMVRQLAQNTQPAVDNDDLEDYTNAEAVRQLTQVL